MRRGFDDVNVGGLVDKMTLTDVRLVFAPFTARFVEIKREVLGLGLATGSHVL